MIDLIDEKARKELAIIEKKFKKAEYKSEEYFSIAKEVYAFKLAYKEAHGDRALTKLVMPRKSKSPYFKSSNSKGNGYGNM
jgi:hypothetical protein